MSSAAPRSLLKGRNAFLFTDPRGNVSRPREGQGFYWEDTRHLSRYALTPWPHRFTSVKDSPSELLDTRIALTVRRPLESPIEVTRRRVLGSYLQERFSVRNPTDVQTSQVLRLTFHADFADTFEVRGMVPSRRRVPHTALSGRSVLLSRTGKDGLLRWTRLTFDPLPNRLNRSRIVWDLYLPPRSETILGVRVEAGTGTPPREPRWTAFETVGQKIRKDRERRRGGWGRVEGDGPFPVWIRRGFEDLLSLLIDVDGFEVPAAGLPWYATLFGRDSLIVGLQTVHLNPRLSMETLQALGNRMADRRDAFRAAEPGKVLHEFNRGELATAGVTPYGPYYGSVDATPLFLCLLHEVYRWTGDLVFCGAMYPFAQGAAHHVMSQLRGPLGFLNYVGADPPALRHQGWKDGEVGILGPDGGQPAFPVAPVEAQGYAYWGLRGAAELAAALGEDDDEAAWTAEAEALQARFHSAFWMTEEGTYALALDGHGERIPLVASNPGHLLMCGLLTDAQARRVAERLFAPDLYSEWGVRTLSSRAPYYDPTSYHHGSVWPHDNALIAFGLARTGRRESAVKLFDGLAAAAEAFGKRLPELFGGADRSRGGPQGIPQACDLQAWAAGVPLMLLRALLGLEADAASGVLRLDPYLPLGMDPLKISGVRVGSSTVALRAEGVRSASSVQIVSQEGPPLTIEGAAEDAR
ncbi:MAG: glycogen debranching N-terminal domain-containing protein [Thermoplasmata archaeon]|nr:glycogen debranching N-terminal domain-containing protein [Thermoplasmata archaeon]